MAYCSKCGKLMEDDATFCSGCGTPLQNQGYMTTNNKSANSGLGVTALVLELLAWWHGLFQ